MKHYPKQYEDVFGTERSLKKCDIDKVSIEGLDWGVERYQMEMRNLMRDYQLMTFDRLVKLVWLVRKFRYDEMTVDLNKSNGQYIDSAFAIFMRHYVGIDWRLITRDFIFSKIISYFDDFFPDFDINNPFESKYEYPFKHVWFEHLVFVNQMDERMELLQQAEKKGMSYIDFLDYLTNYIESYKEEHGPKYEFTFPGMTFWYIKRNPNYEEHERRSNKT